jgi:hypothetical protein
MKVFAKKNLKGHGVKDTSAAIEKMFQFCTKNPDKEWDMGLYMRKFEVDNILNAHFLSLTILLFDKY